MKKLLIATAAFTMACVPPPAPEPAATRSAHPAGSLSATESEILRAINAERRRRGLRALVWDPLLDRAAKIQARNMARLRRMSHNLPETANPTLSGRVRAARYDYRRISENIAFGQRDAEAVVESWMNSPGHRANILDPNVSDTGIGATRVDGGPLYFCQVFGSRL